MLFGDRSLFAPVLRFWNGDILTSYALAGFVAAPLARCSERTLLVLAAIALAVYVAPIPYPELFGADESMHEHLERALRIYGHGGFAEVARFRIHEIRHIAPLLLGSLPRTFALYLLGIAAWRAGLFSPGPGRETPLRWLAAVGILAGGATQIAMFGAAAAEDWWTVGDLAGSVLDGLGQVVLAFGYGAAVVLLARRASWQRVLRPFAALGRGALTNYLMQSVLFGLLFYGYGGALFGRAAGAGRGGRAGRRSFTRCRWPRASRGSSAFGSGRWSGRGDP